MVMMVQAKKSYNSDISAEHVGKIGDIDLYFVRNMMDMGGVRTGKCELYVAEGDSAKFRSPGEADKFLINTVFLDKVEGYVRVEDGAKDEVSYIRLPNKEENKKIVDFLESRR